MTRALAGDSGTLLESDYLGRPSLTAYAPLDDKPGRELWDARRASGNTQDLRGKILRITPRADGGYAIPAGNLFADSTQGRPEIYTMGHRNPYRIAVDRRSGFLYWGDVGPDARADHVDAHDRPGRAGDDRDATELRAELARLGFVVRARIRRASRT